MKCRPLPLPQRTLRKLVYSPVFCITREIKQRVVGATGAHADESGHFWWAVGGKRIIQVKPHFCDPGDFFYVQEAWCDDYYRVLGAPPGKVHGWQLPQTMPSDRSRYTLRVTSIAIERKYATAGWLGPTAEPFIGFSRGRAVCDNPWCWVVRCEVIRTRRDAP